MEIAQWLKFGSQVTARVKAMGVRVCNPGARGGSGGVASEREIIRAFSRGLLVRSYDL